MDFLAHTAHWQFLGLLVGCLAWILTLATAGINEWRLWHVDDVSVVTSGVAWVGIWRACFNSHILTEAESCQSVGISDAFVPAEVKAAQVMMVLAMLCGLAGNVGGGLALRLVYFSLEERGKVRPLFLLTGSLYVLTGALTSVPLVWNMAAVLNNATIHFPPRFHLPAAPANQQVGVAIGLGLFASILMLISGMLFLCYRHVWRSLNTPGDPRHGPWTPSGLAEGSGRAKEDVRGRNNPSFHADHVS
ncbi:claudin-34 [Dunckerocampus dactyliophorus]|uniref:claudin-34 n=1 Tax=Dunckerocampus dactyliophorus TaxID=161453 RepID=UPI002406969D|nr:claudin-34 [Dunckerocampus dactyliophorus]